MNGIKIREGVAIRIPIFDIHYDPKIWKDPETFDPERYILPVYMDMEMDMESYLTWVSL